VLPDGRSIALGNVSNVAYIDASHLEACQSDSQTERGVNRGIAEFMRTLMRQGYLPLLAPDLTRERLERCKLLISIGPALEFTPAECEAVKQFVSAGGTFVCMVGAEQSRPSASLLAEFGFEVPHSPVLPGEKAEEPEPMGAEAASIDQAGTRQFRFHAAWPVKSTETGEKRLVGVEGNDGWAFVYSRSVGSGSVVVIGDTHFAGNENFQPEGRLEPDRVLFWRWLLSRVVPGQTEWNPPEAANADSAGDAEENSGAATK
jgi:hypothetical protein